MCAYGGVLVVLIFIMYLIRSVIKYSTFTAQIVLEEGMVLTVEPGVYFNPTSLQLAHDNTNVTSFLNWTTIDRFRNLGGVRIEDTLLVTSQGMARHHLIEAQQLMLGRACVGCAC